MWPAQARTTAPPPKESTAHILKSVETAFLERGIQDAGVSPAPLRLRFWHMQNEVLGALLAEHGIPLLPPPPGTQTPDGYLHPDFYASDATHANNAYGARVLQQIQDYAMMTDHPYKSLPDKAFWRRAVASPAAAKVDPVGRFDLRIEPATKVATAGSCFAQHVARHLSKAGFNYHITERGHPLLPSEIRSAHNYGTFSARYGNIYTARQLTQLIERAYGRFVPAEAPWVADDGTVRDPFRPNVQPGGYVSVAEMEIDRAQHLAAVREMFETLDVFVFTLGLTECWESLEDGAVFPLCPGVEGGTFDPEKYRFRNQDANEVIADMELFIAALKAVNPDARMILTVSPVPLMATAQPEAQVLSATTYSKSVLRVAADMLERSHDFIHYFPSYEVITGAYNRGRYFADDLRNVTEEGVSHVMRLLLHYATGRTATDQPAPPPAEEQPDETTEMARAFVEVECDEVALDRT